MAVVDKNKNFLYNPVRPAGKLTVCDPSPYVYKGVIVGRYDLSKDRKFYRQLVRPQIKRPRIMRAAPGVDFFQHFMRKLFVQKCFAQHYSSYVLLCNFFGSKISVQKVRVKCWLNWYLYRFISLHAILRSKITACENAGKRVKITST